MLKQLAQAFGFSSILLLLNYVDLTSSSGDVRLHWPRSMRSISIANLLDILIVAGLFAVLLACCRRTRWWPNIRLLLAAALPPLLLSRNLPLMPFEVPAFAVVAITAAWTLLLLALRAKSQDFYTGLTKFCGTVLAGFAIFALLMTTQLVRSMIWQPGPQEIAAASAAPKVAPSDRPLLLWIIYDELSYDQLFEHRDPTLAMPNFDRLRQISTSYSNAQPIAYKTAQIVPSLLIGDRVTDLSYSWSNRLSIQTEKEPGWREFGSSKNLFRLAKEKQQRTAAIGWYLPYCPILGEVLDQCYWTNADALDSEMTPDASLLQNTFAPLRILAKQMVLPKQAASEQVEIEARAHWTSYNDLQSRALSLLRRGDTDFVLLHMPVPHPPGMYSRRRHEFSSTGSYLGSLALADQSLGELLSIVQNSPRWNATTLIVMGDHSWRVAMWSSRPGWSARNQQISGGKFDARPALLIHRPGQSSHHEVTQLFPMLQLHDLMKCRIEAQPDTDCFNRTASPD